MDIVAMQSMTNAQRSSWRGQEGEADMGCSLQLRGRYAARNVMPRDAANSASVSTLGATAR
ncbi:hypothetical protein Xcc1_00290 [Xanthomonas campestris pv. campestris]|nr:hypothetical protein Xcc1_00290 [Xanthomonas campestris pv. campestris]